MGILSKILQPEVKQRARRGASFPGADLGRLTSSWTSDPGAINRQLRYDLRTMRARSRSLCRGDAYASKFVDSCVNNIAGPTPFALQMKISFNTGRPNETANDAIEKAYCRWALPGNCDVTGRLSLAELDRLKIRALARDGECLLRKFFTRDGLQYQLLDIDRLDEQRNDNLKTGAIKMGVEVDMFGKPVAYWILKDHPGELGEWNANRERAVERVPADQVEHLFLSDWPEQVRGFPWLHAAMVRLWHLGAFEEAAVINARVGANKLAVIQSPTGEAAEAMATGIDSMRNLLEDTAPGQYVTLPDGYELSSFNPTFPDAAIEPFIRTLLRGVAAAVGMAYHSLANDPAQVNYSTARVALLEERDMWMSLQKWYIEHCCIPRLRDFLRAEEVVGRLKDYSGFADQARFQPKTWGWVDPLKEVNAKVMALGSQLTSRTRIAAEGGEDIEDILDELAAEQAMAKDKGVILQEQKPGLAATVPEDPEAQAVAQEEAGASAPTPAKKLNGKAHNSAASH